MEQLIRITSVPIEYQIQLEHARLQKGQSNRLGFDIERRPPQMQVESQNIKVRMDTVDMRSSLGLKSPAATMAEAAQRGKQAAMDVTAQFAEDGNQMVRGTDITQIVTDRLYAQPTTMTAFIPSVGPAITWQPNKISMKYDPGDITFDWHTMRNTMDYVPGKFSMSILQYPKVNIEYVGEPNYVPPSSSPNYRG